MVRSCLAPGGRVFFADSRHVESSTSVDQALPPAGATTAVRRLEDGREYTIVKVFHEPDALERRLARLGWRATVRATPTYFVVGEAAPAR
jgi:demethylmenaquinone methyltransferase/2-methoxy-6-polyprenyl-1,4-benzoquinol methylase